MNDVGLLTRAALASFIGNFALFGDTAPLGATWLIAVTGGNLAPAWYLVGAAGVALVAMLASRETSRLRLVDD
ncbi:hypothetical protein LMG28688_06026 [Paraburkholderia caffeinitolerans]|uniref:Uncharacterized protein n=1 Tax=Paraburkholderia caffeinitolerans TaxID=1723730 RepID=A0A6J5GRC7_9BURK|nr:hypothetical protein [Paraburkholderia caffeinitolerans]CAB3804608.1 hypothetical protein LMG28688_06026 [Paraburkholderia caffeinitolerans]